MAFQTLTPYSPRGFNVWMLRNVLNQAGSDAILVFSCLKLWLHGECALRFQVRFLRFFLAYPNATNLLFGNLFTIPGPSKEILKLGPGNI